MRMGLGGTGVPGSPSRRMMIRFFHSFGCLRIFSSAVRMESAREAMAPASRASWPITWNCLEEEMLVKGCRRTGASVAGAAAGGTDISPDGAAGAGTGSATGATLDRPCRTGRSEESSRWSVSGTGKGTVSSCAAAGGALSPRSASCPQTQGTRSRRGRRKLVHVPAGIIGRDRVNRIVPPGSRNPLPHDLRGTGGP